MAGSAILTERKRTAQVCLAVAVTLGVAPCFGKVKVEYDKKVDLSHYKTYEWYAPRVLKKTGIAEDDPVVAPQIRAAVNRELTRRGLTEVVSGGDLKVSTWAFAEAIPNVDVLLYGFGALPAGSFLDPVTAPVATIGRYNRQGTVVVNLIDAKRNTSAWAGAATSSYSDVNNLSGPINKAVKDMFGKYPIKAR